MTGTYTEDCKCGGYAEGNCPFCGEPLGDGPLVIEDMGGSRDEDGKAGDANPVGVCLACAAQGVFPPRVPNKVYVHERILDAALAERDGWVHYPVYGPGWFAVVAPGAEVPPPTERWWDIDSAWKADVEPDLFTEEECLDDVRRDANKALRWLKDVDAEISTVEREVAERVAELEAEIAAVKARGEKMARPARRKREYILFRYTSTFHALLRLSRKKSLELLDGAVKMVADNRPTIRITDGDAARKWADAHDVTGVVKYEEKLLVTPLKEWWKCTGEVPDGCEFVPGAEHLDVVTGGGEKS